MAFHPIIYGNDFSKDACVGFDELKADYGAYVHNHPNYEAVCKKVGAISKDCMDLHAQITQLEEMLCCLNKCHCWFDSYKLEGESPKIQAIDDAKMIAVIQAALKDLQGVS